MLEKTLESPLDCKEIEPVNPKGNQSWIFTGQTHAQAESPILRLPDAKSRLIGKDSDARKNWKQEKGMTEDEMVAWHHQLSEHELEQTPGNGEGQGRLVCCSPWGSKELDMTGWLNNNMRSIQFFEKWVKKFKANSSFIPTHLFKYFGATNVPFGIRPFGFKFHVYLLLCGRHWEHLSFLSLVPHLLNRSVNYSHSTVLLGLL